MANDARNRLRSMGGIMASSPELMQAAQGFQVGGPVLIPQNAVGPFEGDPIVDLVETSGANRTSSAVPPELRAILDELDISPEDFAALDPEEQQAILDDPVRVMRERTAEMYPAERRSRAANIASRRYDQQLRLKEERALETADAEDAAADEFERLRRARPSLAPEDDEGSIEPQPLTQEQADKVTSLIEEGPTRKKDLRSRYEETLALFKDVYGVDDNDQARDKAMSLATIGLAIAAGQSPNALTNIAQGLLVGTQGIAKRREAARERETKLRIAALETAAEQMKAEAENVPEFYDDTATEIESPFGTFEVFRTTRQGHASGRPDVFKDPQAVIAAYGRKMDERGRIEGNLNRAMDLLRDHPKKIAGLGGMFARAREEFGAAIGRTPDIDTSNLTPAQEYDAIMTQLAAELAPVILGESGRTISDGDRKRVAEALGFIVDPTSVDDVVGIKLTGFSPLTTQPNKLLKSLEMLSGRLSEAYGASDDFMRQYFPGQLEEKKAGESSVIQGYTIKEVS